MKRLIYADNAATTKMSQAACEAMMRFQLTDFANVSQPYSFARSAKKALKEARETIARCINASPNEIFFTSCGTESDNWVIKGCKCSRIYTSLIEHHAILNACIDVASAGKEVFYIPVNNTGMIDFQTLNNLLSEKSLVSIMMANNEIGTIQPIKQLARIVHDHNSLFHTDAVQAVGHIPVDVRDLDVDFLSASAHKFNGPKGIGFLYIKEGLKINPLISGGAQENSLRAGTENVASIVAMAIALEENTSQLEDNMTYIQGLENALIQKLLSLNVVFHKNGAEVKIPGNVSLSFNGFSGESLLHRLDLCGICVSTGSACDSRNTQISHVLKAIGVDESLAKGTIRISLGKDNTQDDVNRIVEVLADIVK